MCDFSGPFLRFCLSRQCVLYPAEVHAVQGFSRGRQPLQVSKLWLWLYLMYWVGKGDLYIQSINFLHFTYNNIDCEYHVSRALNYSHLMIFIYITYNYLLCVCSWGYRSAAWMDVCLVPHQMTSLASSLSYAARYDQAAISSTIISLNKSVNFSLSSWVYNSYATDINVLANSQRIFEASITKWWER